MFKLIHRHFLWRLERFYSKSHWHLVLELSLLIIIICLAVSTIILYRYRPNLPSFGFYVRPVLDLNNPPLNLEFTLAEQAISLNDGVDLKIVFKNNGPTVIANLKLTLETSDANFSVKKIENTANDNRLEIDNQIINFTKIPAGQGGEVELKIYFASRQSEARVINWRGRSEYSVSDQIIKDDFSLPALKVKAELSVSEAAYYTSPQGDQLGVGPLPPLVGIPTDYWIFWEAQSQYDWTNLVMAARLPKGVELTGKRSLLAGDFNYNPETRQLIWKIPSLAGRPESYRLGFEVQLVPTKDQVGQVLPLLSGPKYYATDVLIGTDTGGTLEALSTDLSKDRFNAGQGKVVGE